MSVSHGIEIHEETRISIQDLVRNTTERLESDFSRFGFKIHRFPRSLRHTNDKDDPYIVPSFVSLGPYHHGSPHLQGVEEVKCVAAHHWCARSGYSVEQVYGTILTIAGEARGYYDGDSVLGFTDAEFAVMMFLDGCFLLSYMYAFGDGGREESPLLLSRMILSQGPGMLRDIFLLENQLPWLVLEALMTFMDGNPVVEFVTSVGMSLDITPFSNKTISRDEFVRYKPTHLLGLLRYYQIGIETHEELILGGNDTGSSSSSHAKIGAIELAQIGLKLTASDKSWFADISIKKHLVFGEISLRPLFLNDFTACWLVNMVAFEVSTSTGYPSDGYIVSSYLSFLSMLMDKEEDLQRLRTKHILHSSFSNQELLEFFKGFTRQLRLGYRYLAIMEEIKQYKYQRRAWISVHRFLYNNIKTISSSISIAGMISIAGVLLGIFKTLMSLKKNQD